MAKLYTKKEIISAIKAGKTAFSLQWIEGRGLLTEIYGKLDSFVQFIALIVASLLLRTNSEDIDGVIAELGKEIKVYYEKGKKKPIETETHNLKDYCK